jgi:SpoVK/Ycf46/Vps4 family AAA+-type ATPase
MNRLDDVVSGRADQKYHFLFGFGVQDVFPLRDGTLVDFKFALNESLKNQGFLRVLHIDPINMVHCVDDESRMNAATVLWQWREEVLNNGVVPGIRQGPLGSANRSRQGDQAAIITNGLGDVHGFRLIDIMMKESLNVRTALVIYDAITFTQYFDSPRILLGILSDWYQSETLNRNECFFCLPVSNRENALDLISHSQLGKFFCDGAVGKTNAYEISTPSVTEIYPILKSQYRHKFLNEDELNQCARIISTENELLRTWIDRFSAVNRIDDRLIKDRKWVRSAMVDSRNINEKLQDFQGLEEIKKFIIDLYDFSRFISQQKEKDQTISLHMVFTGSPGTGKTSIARLLGQVFQETGLLRKGHLIEIQGSDLVADHVGGTGVKVNKVVNQALDGILFIDEAYSLAGSERGGYAQEAVEVLLKRMEDERDRLVVVLAGYDEKMNDFLNLNPGLKRRFPVANRLRFPDLTEEQLISICKMMLTKLNFSWNEDIDQEINSMIYENRKRQPLNYGNAGEIRNLVENINLRAKARMARENQATYSLTLNDLPDEYKSLRRFSTPTIDELLAPYNKFIGLESVKTYLSRLLKTILLDQKMGKKGISKSNNFSFIFVGNPGTGKTSVAHLLVDTLFALGLVQQKRITDVSAVDLIAGYVGQTAEKTRKVLENSRGGVLFMDEAYSLIPGGNSHTSGYGQEAINEIVKFLTEDNNIVVIMAGYPEKMAELLNSNPGLISRFSQILTFPDYSDDELLKIMITICTAEGFILPDPMAPLIKTMFQQVREQCNKSFGNAREAMRLFNHMKQNLASRAISSQGTLVDDLPLEPGWNTFRPSDLEGYEIIPDEVSEPQSEWMKYYIPRPNKISQDNH